MEKHEQDVLKLLECFGYPAGWAADISRIFDKAKLHDGIARDIESRPKEDEVALRRAERALPSQQSKTLRESKRNLESLYNDQLMLRKEDLGGFFDVGGRGRRTSPKGRQRGFVLEGLIARFDEEFDAPPAINPTTKLTSFSDEDMDYAGSPASQPFILFVQKLFLLMGKREWNNGLEAAARDALTAYRCRPEIVDDDPN